MENKIKPVPLEEINRLAKNTIMDVLGISFTGIDETKLVAKMPVDKRTHQVHGILHGGASVVLAETIGSVGASLFVDPTKFRCAGMEINANHLRSVASGFVIGTGTPLHVGKNTQVWDIKIHSEEGKLVCVSRLTVAVIPL